MTSKFVGVIYWPWPIYLPSTMTVSQTLFKILSGHDVANGRTDGRTPYHNKSEVSLRSYKKGGMGYLQKQAVTTVTSLCYIFGLNYVNWKQNTTLVIMLFLWSCKITFFKGLIAIFVRIWSKSAQTELALLGKFSNLRLGVYTLFAHENSNQSLYLPFLHHFFLLKQIF